MNAYLLLCVVSSIGSAPPAALQKSYLLAAGEPEHPGVWPDGRMAIYDDCWNIEPRLMMAVAGRTLYADEPTGFKAQDHVVGALCLLCLCVCVHMCVVGKTLLRKTGSHTCSHQWTVGLGKSLMCVAGFAPGNHFLPSSRCD